MPENAADKADQQHEWPRKSANNTIAGNQYWHPAGRYQRRCRCSRRQALSAIASTTPARTRSRNSGRRRSSGAGFQSVVQQRRTRRGEKGRPRNGVIVGNIYKHCLAYKMVTEKTEQRAGAANAAKLPVQK
ncbi:MAG: hypothetical protein MZU95_01130 [Desulfomicrobium escambiense]|nr:hypothetical protein [Desulfomicrobium escambiense]